MADRGWDALDILLVTGDAYVDHPSFGVPALGRYLESKGYRVGILDVPELEPDGQGWTRLPSPELYVGVSAGTIDSMVTNYTASKRKRHVDVYRPGGKPGRPNRATIAYTSLAKHHFPGVPIIIGGLEAGPRRFAHYDYWQDALRRSILVDAKADLLIWGMGERQSVIVAERLAAEPDREGISQRRILSGVGGTCEIVRGEDLPQDPALLRHVPGFEAMQADPMLAIEAFNVAREENSPSSKMVA